MANPTAKTGGEVIDHSGLAIKATQFQDVNGNVIGAAQQSNIADLAAAALSTSDTYTDAAVNTALDLVIDKINAILTALENAGILADS